jgi:hypothetical protein
MPRVGADRHRAPQSEGASTTAADRWRRPTAKGRPRTAWGSVASSHQSQGCRFSDWVWYEVGER